MKRLQHLLIFVIVLLASCQPSGNPPNLPVQEAQETQQAAINTGVNSEDLSSENMSPLPQSAPDQPVDLPISVSASANDDVLKFTFPPPNTEPVSLWRPPLSDLPWALNPHDHFYFSRPIAADEVNWPLPDYRYGGTFSGTDTVHTGIDIPAERGTTVIAAGKGKVVWAGYGIYNGAGDSNDPYGLAVSIEHDFGFEGKKLYTIYAHLDRIDVVNGQQVDTGTNLGIVGMTGNTTGPHLHFEVRMDEDSFFTTRNPELWIAPPQGWGVLTGDFRNTNGSFLDQYPVRIRAIETGQRWEVNTYGSIAVHKDDYYAENLAIGDLPAGEYELTVDYLEETYICQFAIFPGAVTYITFQGQEGCGYDLPPVPEPETWLANE